MTCHAIIFLGWIREVKLTEKIKNKLEFIDSKMGKFNRKTTPLPTFFVICILSAWVLLFIFMAVSILL